MKSCFHTKVVGVTFTNAQNIIPKLKPDMGLKLVRQHDNPYDSNAIAVFFANHHLGYLPKAVSQKLAPLIDSGSCWKVTVANITGGHDGEYYGINISLQRTELI